MSEYTNSVLDPDNIRDFYSSMWGESSTQYYGFYNDFSDYSSNNVDSNHDITNYSTLTDSQFNYPQPTQYHEIYVPTPLALLESNSYMLPKPQNSFPYVIDNSSFPFIPKITHKFHAKIEIPNYVAKAQQILLGDTEIKVSQNLFGNPYQFELNTIKFNKWQVNPIDSYFPSLEVIPIEIVEDVRGLLKMIEEVSLEREIAVDLEHHSLRSYQGILCLIQVSTRFKDYIIDPLKIPSQVHLLGHIFANPNIVKVMHGAINDIYWLQRDYGLYIVNMFDTFISSRELNKTSLGLAYLLKTYCDIDADKRYQLADWRLRPLTPDMIKYARMDTHYLLYIYDKLKEELIHKAINCNIHYLSFVYSVLESSKQLCLNTYVKNEFQLGSDKFLNKLGGFRDTIARMEDESPEFIIPQSSLMKIVKQAPKSIEELLSIDSSPFILKHSAYIVKIFQKKQIQKNRTQISDIFTSSGWDKTQCLPYLNLHQKILKQEGITTDSIYEFCSESDEKRTAYNLLKTIKDKSKADYIKGMQNAENLAPKKKTKELQLDYANIDALLDNTVVDENQIPKSMQEIYEISKNSKKKSKAKNVVIEEVTESKTKGKEKNIHSFLKEIGWVVNV